MFEHDESDDHDENPADDREPLAGAGVDNRPAAHELAFVVPSASRPGIRAVCSCGFTTPVYASAGLAQSMVDAHVRRERAKEMWIKAGLMRLDALAQRVQIKQRRRWLDEVKSAVRLRQERAPVPSPAGAGWITVAAVDDDPHLRRELATAISAREQFHLVGQGATGVDAAALAIVERPQFLIVDDDMPVMGGLDAIRLVRELVPDTWTCLYTEGANRPDLADLVIAKEVPAEGVVDRLAQLFT